MGVHPSGWTRRRDRGSGPAAAWGEGGNRAAEKKRRRRRREQAAATRPGKAQGEARAARKTPGSSHRPKQQGKRPRRDAAQRGAGADGSTGATAGSDAQPGERAAILERRKAQGARSATRSARSLEGDRLPAEATTKARRRRARMQPPQAGPPGAPGAALCSHDRERTGGSRGGTRRSRRSRKPRRQPEQRMHRRRASPKRARGASQERRAKGGGKSCLSPLLTASQSVFHGVGRVFPFCPACQRLSGAKFRGFLRKGLDVRT